MKMWQALKHIQDNGPMYEYYGICFNTERMLGTYRGVYRLIAEAAPNWIGCTNDKYHPVGGKYEYDDKDELWDNPKRHEFLNFLIDYFKMLDK